MRHDPTPMIQSASLYLGNAIQTRFFVCGKCWRDVEANGSTNTVPVCSGLNEEITWIFPKEETYATF